jgi:glycosyltransferase involved in cell wall biosynthesis
LVPARDPDAMAEAISALLRNPDLRNRMGTAARSRVVGKHSLESMTQAYASLYLELVHAC